MGAISVGLERVLAVHPFWLLFPSSAMLASVALYAARIPFLYQGGLVRETRAGFWLLEQVATWATVLLSVPPLGAKRYASMSHTATATGQRRS